MSLNFSSKSTLFCICTHNIVQIRIFYTKYVSHFQLMALTWSNIQGKDKTRKNKTMFYLALDIFLNTFSLFLNFLEFTIQIPKHTLIYHHITLKIVSSLTNFSSCRLTLELEQPLQLEFLPFYYFVPNSESNEEQRSFSLNRYFCSSINKWFQFRCAVVQITWM